MTVPVQYSAHGGCLCYVLGEEKLLFLIVLFSLSLSLSFSLSLSLSLSLLFGGRDNVVCGLALSQSSQASCGPRFHDPCEIAYQKKAMKRLLKGFQEFSAEKPFRSYIVRDIVIHAGDPRPTSFVAARSLKDAEPHKYITDYMDKHKSCEICVEFITIPEYIEKHGWIRHKTYFEIGALTGTPGSNSLLFDTFMGWSGTHAAHYLLLCVCVPVWVDGVVVSVGRHLFVSNVCCLAL